MRAWWGNLGRIAIGLCVCVSLLTAALRRPFDVVVAADLGDIPLVGAHLRLRGCVNASLVNTVSRVFSMYAKPSSKATSASCRKNLDHSSDWSPRADARKAMA